MLSELEIPSWFQFLAIPRVLLFRNDIVERGTEGPVSFLQMLLHYIQILVIQLLSAQLPAPSLHVYTLFVC